MIVKAVIYDEFRRKLFELAPDRDGLEHDERPTDARTQAIRDAIKTLDKMDRYDIPTSGWRCYACGGEVGWQSAVRSSLCRWHREFR